MGLLLCLMNKKCHKRVHLQSMCLTFTKKTHRIHPSFLFIVGINTNRHFARGMMGNQ
jgi:hypothetical protein